MRQYEQTWFYQRIFFPQIETEAKLDNLLPILEKIASEGLILCTGSHQIDSGVLPEAAFDSRQRDFARAAFWFKRYAHELHVSVLATLGHMACSPQQARRLDFDYMHGPDGTVTHGIASPHDARYHRYLKRLYRWAASVKPKVIWLGDDFPPVGREPMRFCDFSPRALAAFNRKYKHRLTRPALVAALLCDQLEPSPIRRQWLAFNRAAMLKLCRQIRSAVHSVSPNTHIGLMSTNYPGFQCAGLKLSEALAALAGPGRRPLHRPSGGFHDDLIREDILMGLAQACRGRALTEANTRSFAEIGNMPWTSSDKSAHSVHTQSALHLVCGFKQQMFELFDSMGNYPCIDVNVQEGMSHFQNWCDRLASELPDTPALRGVRVWADENLPLVARARRKSFEDFLPKQPWPMLLARCGIPVCFDGEPDCWLVTGDQVLSMTHNQINGVIARGAVFDALAAENLCALGYGELLGVRCIGPTQDAVAEIISNSQFCPLFQGHRFPFPTEPELPLRVFEPIEMRSAEITKLMIRDQPNKTPGTIAYQTPQGHRGLILPYSFDHGGWLGYVRPSRKQLMCELLEWIMRARMRVWVGGQNDLAPFYVEDAQRDRVILALLNLGTGSVQNPEIRLGTFPKHMPRVRWFDVAGRLREVSRARRNARPPHRLNLAALPPIPAMSLRVLMLGS